MFKGRWNQLAQFFSIMAIEGGIEVQNEIGLTVSTLPGGLD